MKTWRNEKLLVLNDESWAAVDLYYRAGHSIPFLLSFSSLRMSWMVKEKRIDGHWRPREQSSLQSSTHSSIINSQSEIDWIDWKRLMELKCCCSIGDWWDVVLFVVFDFWWVMAAAAAGAPPKRRKQTIKQHFIQSIKAIKNEWDWRQLVFDEVNLI